MKLTLNAFLGAACLAVGLVGSQTTASATPVTGELDFVGVATTDTGKLSTAKAFTSFSSVTTLGNETGSYASLGDGASVSMQGFTFNPVGKGVSPLWTIDSNGLLYTFDLTKVTNFTYNSSTTGLTIKGIGIADITGDSTDASGRFASTGYTPTAGTFTFSTQAGGPNSSKFTFSSATTAVPDSGTTVALLGLSLVAVEGTRRALNAKRAVKA